MFDTSHPAWEQSPRISHWVFEPVAGQISGCDGEGRVLMAIAADPLFGARLAAAFDARCVAQWPALGAKANGQAAQPAFAY